MKVVEVKEVIGKLVIFEFIKGQSACIDWLRLLERGLMGVVRGPVSGVFPGFESGILFVGEGRDVGSSGGRVVGVVVVLECGSVAFTQHITTKQNKL